VDGPVGERAMEPVIGVDQLPVVHGMTVGELALMFNEERGKQQLPKADLTVVPLKNYSRQQWYDQTGLPWIKPSPNMLTLITATLYPATCLLEGTNVSEGRGTLQPFEHIAAPWIDGKDLAHRLNEYQLEGVHFRSGSITPGGTVDGIEIYPPKYMGETCHSAAIEVTDREALKSAKASVYILHALYQLYPQQLEWREGRMDGLWKTAAVREQILAGKEPEEIIVQWQSELEYFHKVRNQYLLY